jgi:hypothetical protein
LAWKRLKQERRVSFFFNSAIQRRMQKPNVQNQNKMFGIHQLDGRPVRHIQQTHSKMGNRTELTDWLLPITFNLSASWSAIEPFLLIGRFQVWRHKATIDDRRKSFKNDSYSIISYCSIKVRVEFKVKSKLIGCTVDS